MFQKIFILSILFISFNSFSQQNGLLKDAKKIEEIYNYIHYMYVDEVNSKEITESAIVAA